MRVIKSPLLYCKEKVIKGMNYENTNGINYDVKRTDMFLDYLFMLESLEVEE